MNYISLAIIGEVDSIYVAVNATRQYKAIADDESFPPYKIFDKKNKNLSRNDRPCCNFILYGLYRFIKIFYSIGYYYFFPLLVFNLTYQIKGNLSCEHVELGDENFCYTPYHSFKYPEIEFTHVHVPKLWSTWS